MIVFRNITKKFDKKIAVNNISLEIDKGQIFGILGPNGAGKTTIIKMLISMLEQSSGTISVNGLDNIKNSFEIKKITSYVSDNPDIYTTLTGMQYLNFIGNIYNVSKDDIEKNVDKYKKLLELSDENLFTYISDYSHGMKQKLVLISAFITNPEIIVLDEPMVGLDVKTSYNLKNILKDLANMGKTIIFSTHIMEIAQSICDKIAIVDKGNLIYCDNVSKIDGSLEKMFLELTQNEEK